jgi:hypothetical protein
MRHLWGYFWRYGICAWFPGCWCHFEWTEQIISINTDKLIQTFFAMILQNIIFFKIRQIIWNKFNNPKGDSFKENHLMTTAVAIQLFGSWFQKTRLLYQLNVKQVKQAMIMMVTFKRLVSTRLNPVQCGSKRLKKFTLESNRKWKENR